MKISLIIPTFNRRTELMDLLLLLGNMGKPSGVELDIIVVVDGSTDGTSEMLSREFPKVHVVTGDGHWWYTRSMNEGFKYARSLKPDLVLTLNDDILLPHDYLIHLLNSYQRFNDRSIVGSISFTHIKPHRITNSGIKQWNRILDRSTSYFPFLQEIEPDSLTGVKSTPVLPGRGMLIPWTVLEELDFFDEKFIQYHSDFDFTLRAKKKGIGVFVSWDAKVFGFLEKTSAGSSFLKSSALSFVKEFNNPYGRYYVPDRARYYWRHGVKILWPWYMLKFFLLASTNHFFKNKAG